MLADVTLRMMKLVDLAIGKPKYTYEMQENQPKPKGPFAAVKIVSEAYPATDKVDMLVDSEGRDFYRTTGIRIITFDVFFAEGGYVSSVFSSSFRRHDMVDYMVREGIAVMHHSRVNNEGTTIDTNWELKDRVRVTCSVMVQFDTFVDIVETVETTGSLIQEYDEVEIHTHTTIKDL